MTILWEQYVYRRGSQVEELWEEMFADRNPRVLYIAGCGFDVRVTTVLTKFLNCAKESGVVFACADLALVQLDGYELGDELRAQTAENREALQDLFSTVGGVSMVPVQLADTDPEFRVAHALQQASKTVVELIGDHTDVILDVSSLPRIVYLALMTRILDQVIPSNRGVDALSTSNINFQVIVAEDARLDGHIRSEDPSEDLVMIPGFGGGVKVEAMSEWPVVWFPVLGEGKTAQFDKVAGLAEIPSEAEVCPILPHPSRHPRRGDRLLLEYREQLFKSRRPTPMSNVMFVHESHPFEAYRQLQKAIARYAESLSVLGGCRILVTPLSSKLLTVAVGLACFEMKPVGEEPSYALGIPCAAPTRYVASRAELLASEPELSALLLTGIAYANDV